MDMTRPMSILLVEDDEKDCDMYKNYCYTREDVKLIGIAKSAEEALQYVKAHVPEGIILDIELNDGTGSGLEFLEELKNVSINFKPLIVITTNIVSKSVYNYVHNNGADLIFHKLREDYSPELVIKNLLILRKSIYDVKTANKEEYNNVETINERNQRMSDRINRELDLIGIGAHLAGRTYIHDAIIYILENKNNNETVFIHLARKYKKGNSTIGRAVQTAIEHAWRKSSTEDLQKYYTAAVNYNTGVPTPTEFIYYYVDRIKKLV